MPREELRERSLPRQTLPGFKVGNYVYVYVVESISVCISLHTQTRKLQEKRVKVQSRYLLSPTNRNRLCIMYLVYPYRLNSHYYVYRSVLYPSTVFIHSHYEDFWKWARRKVDILKGEGKVEGQEERKKVTMLN